MSPARATIAQSKRSGFYHLLLVNNDFEAAFSKLCEHVRLEYSSEPAQEPTTPKNTSAKANMMRRAKQRKGGADAQTEAAARAEAEDMRAQIQANVNKRAEAEQFDLRAEAAALDMRAQIRNNVERRAEEEKEEKTDIKQQIRDNVKQR